MKYVLCKRKLASFSLGFIPILVIKMELFKKSMRLILTSISSLIFCQAGRIKRCQIFTETDLFPCVSLKKSLRIVQYQFVLKLVKLTLQLNLSKIENVYTCQRSVGAFDDDCERLYSRKVKTTKRGRDHVNSGRILLNTVDHYEIEKEM